MSKKEKKDKIRYIDDGYSFTDMSGTGRKQNKNYSAPPKPSFKEQFKTYCEACKMMFLPMLAVMGGICIIFLILWLLF